MRWRLPEPDMGELPGRGMQREFWMGPQSKLATPRTAQSLPPTSPRCTHDGLTPQSLRPQVIVCANGVNFTRVGPLTNLTTGTFTDDEPSDADVRLPPRVSTTCK